MALVKKNMKAWLLDKISSINDLHLSEVSDPVPQPDEVLLDIHFAALNPADRYLAEGAYPARPAFPHILGRDAVGTIARLGSVPSSLATPKTTAPERR